MTGNDPSLKEGDLALGFFEGAFIALWASGSRAPPAAEQVQEDG
jgi:hypothetical protein